jgi:hypothetical protein
MAGTLVVDTIQSSVSLTPPTITDSAGTQIGTLCRAWVNFNGVTTAIIRSSFNISSVIRNGVGGYTINLINAMPDANYSVVHGYTPSTSHPYVGEIQSQTTSSLTTYYMRYDTGAPLDMSMISLAIFR